MSQSPCVTASQLKKLKNQAKEIKKEKNISHAEALEIVARRNCFGNWKAIVKASDYDASIKMPTPNISQTFIDDPDVILDDNDQQLLQQERTKDIDETTKLRVHNNKKVLTQLAIEFSIFEPTRTGLKKSILDATQVVRTHFEITNFHHYGQQGQGAGEHGIKKTAFLLTSEKLIPTTVSLYRPKTKKGDPRMWFSSLPNFTSAGTQIAIIIHNDCAYLIDLSAVNLTLEFESTTNQIKKFVDSYLSKNNAIANELLNKLKELAKAPIKATHVGDTAVGMSIENALGIQANSSKLPDYKGIELKSGRNAEKNRTTIFAQVAEWEISPYKKSADILDRFGYFREDDFKLYCTISTRKSNSQGLIFKIEEDILQEWCAKYEDDRNIFKEHIASWSGKLLRKRLKDKHSETFWIEAKSQFIDGIEYFQLISVTHTKAPLLNQLMPLLESGTITMDHLIKRSAKNGRVSEKGPLFKINSRDLDLIFPEPVKYSLL
ncbi:MULTISPECIES: MvaI/BcnI family restriction endonuclease [Yersinia]|uniref:MvaI/BcnI restriction endonuclease domain-containing protein n=1 Tax=Yersinia frederiksenii TaxID=29484 RepID=A0AAI8ZN02_YERFR|nr:MULTISPECIES: MvaI/BcnI family restriction endonuclease [Yersinia]MDN0125922.1 MvaI/BcnI family restriction endonuclease [Yersinia massiliensis]CFQ85481.1 Uncharacterised protein [Yersinia frederiksenii]